MENLAIGEIVTISPTYTSEVNIAMDFTNPDMNAQKVEGYIPTAPARHALSKIMQGLMPMSGKRVHLITGMYGTGKSHFGLVLANLFGLQPNDALLQPLMDKLNEKDPEVAQIVRTRRAAITQKFLVVILNPTAERGGFNYSLLSALQSSLKSAGLDFTPKTRFGDAASILETWMGDSEFSPRLQKELGNHHTDERRLLISLRDLKSDAYDQFCTIYKALTRVPFHPENFGDPLQVYPDTAKYLRASADMAGILVVADEFGRYLSEIARDSDSQESKAIQDFLEFCKRTREDQVHFLVIAHRTLADYAAGYRSQADWEKVSGRFLDSEYSLNLAGGDLDIVDMIDAVIISRTDTPERNEIWEQVRSELHPVQDWLLDARLFPQISREWLQQSLLFGCYPLHPATTFCLPWLAQRVGQANRSALWFLGSTEQGGLLEYVGAETVFSDQESLNLFTPDRLLTYFGQGANEKPIYRPIMLAHEQAVSTAGSERSARRIIDLLAILEIVAQPSLQPKRETILAILSATPAEESEIGDILDALTQERVIRLRPATGRYELPRRDTGEIDVYEAIASVKERLRPLFNLIDALGTSVDLSPITARHYEEKYAVPRTATRQLISSRHLSNLDTYRERIADWYLPKRSNYQGDALMLYVVAESEQEIDAARDRAANGTGTDQLIVLIPRQPFTGGEAALDLSAIEHLRSLDLKLDEGSIDSEDLQKAEHERRIQIDKALKMYMSADNFSWYYGDNVAASVPSNGEEETISNIMLSVFNKTPVVRDEALTGTSTGRDKQKKYRIQAMQQLLEVDGPIKIMTSVGQANERMLRAALVDTDILQKTKDLGKAAEYEVRKVVPDGSSLAEVWRYLRDRLTRPNQSVQLKEPISKLMAPPYGISNQLLEILLATVLRTVKDQSVILGNQSRVTQTGQPNDYTRIPMIAEKMPSLISDPDNYILIYYEVLPSQKAFLQQLIDLLDPEGKSTDPGGLWERARDALVAWYARLPVATRVAGELSTPAQELTELLNSEKNLGDARRLLSVEIPGALSVKVSSPWGDQTTQELWSAFRPVYEELQNFIHTRAQIVIEQLCDLFGTSGRTRASLDEACQQWYSELSEAQRLHQFSGEAGQLVRMVSEQGDIIDRYLVKLPQGMGMAPYTDWVDPSVSKAFALHVQVAKQQVETWSPGRPEEPTSPEVDARIRRDVAVRQIRAILASSNLPKDDQTNILIGLLAELRQ
jgi:hypothetical protein